MSSYKIRTLESGQEKARQSGDNTFDFLSIRVGPNNLELKEFDSSNFDFNAKGISNVGNVDGRDVSADGALLDSHLDGGANKHDATEVDYERVDASKKDIQAASDDVESALSDLDDRKISRTGSIAFTANQSMGGFRLTNLADPSSAQDAVTKAYADGISAGLDPKASCRLATTTALPGYTPSGSGVGKTLTATANGALVVDSTAVAVGDRVLVWLEPSAVHNGIYTVTATGDGSNPFILTRAADFDGSPASEVSGGAHTYIEQGPTYAGNGFVVIWNGSVVVDTDAINFSQFSGIGVLIGGAGILKTSNTISVELATDPGLEFDVVGDNGKLRVLVDPAGALERVTAGLDVKNDGINEFHINSSALFEGLTGGSGTALSVWHDGLGLQFVTNQLSLELDGTSLSKSATGLRVAALGVTAAMIANATITATQLATSVAGAGLTGGAGTNLAVELATNSGLEFDAVGDAGKLQIKIDPTGGLERVALGIGIADDGVTRDMLNSNVVGGDIVSGLKQETNGQLSRQDAVSLTNDNASAITIRQFVYIKSTGNVDLAKADAAATATGKLGVVEDASIASGASGNIITRRGAVIGGFSSLTIGATYYLSASTAGAITNTAPTGTGQFWRPVGEAISATELELNPETAVELV